MKQSVKKVISVIYAIAIVGLLWEVAHLSFNSFVVPSPIEAVGYTFKHIPVLMGHLLSSSLRILAGLFLTLLVGVSLGIGMGINKMIDYTITPIVYLFYPVPRIAFLPIFMILFGLGDASKIILIFAISVFHLLVNIRDALKGLPQNYFTTAHLLGLNRWQKLRYIIVPALMPALFTSLKMVLGSSIAALFFAENYATKQGIGYYIMNAWIKADYVEMYSGIMAISLLGMLLFKGIDALQNSICGWKIHE